MSISSLCDSGRRSIMKLMMDNFDFYLGFGKLPLDYPITWDIDEVVPSYIAKKINSENVTRLISSNVDYLVNKDVQSILNIYSPAVSSNGVLNVYISINGVPGIAGNIEITLTPGGFAGNETLNFSNGVLTVLIENNVTTRQQLASILATAQMISSAQVLSSPNTPITIGLATDTVNLIGGKEQVNYLENQDFKIGYSSNNDNIPIGAIKWLSSVKPNDNQVYQVSYWYKDLLSNQTSLLNLFGFKKAVAKNYVIEDANGSIRANDKKWSISNVPTSHLSLMFFIDNLDIVEGEVIRQYGLFVNTVPNTGLDPSHFYSLNEITSQGDLLVLDNLSPYRIESINSSNISIVLSI